MQRAARFRADDVVRRSAQAKDGGVRFASKKDEAALVILTLSIWPPVERHLAAKVSTGVVHRSESELLLEELQDDCELYVIAWFRRRLSDADLDEWEFNGQVSADCLEELPGNLLIEHVNLPTRQVDVVLDWVD